MNEYVQACRRFWWILLIGLVAALAVGYEVAKHHSPPTYSSTLKMIVDSPSRPFLRTGVTSVTAQPARTQIVKTPVRHADGTITYRTQLVTIPQSSAVTDQTPDTQTLVSAANLYPSLIESDAVATLREKLFGPINGTVTATAEFATTTPTGKFVASTFPIIDIAAKTHGPHAASTLAWGTFVSFKRWLLSNQDLTAVPKSQRITVRTLVAPKQAVRTEHSQKGLAIVAFFGVLAGAIFFVIVLDKLVPRRARKPVEAPQEGEEDLIVGPTRPAVTVPPEI